MFTLNNSGTQILDDGKVFFEVKDGGKIEAFSKGFYVYEDLKQAVSYILFNTQKKLIKYKDLVTRKIYNLNDVEFSVTFCDNDNGTFDLYIKYDENDDDFFLLYTNFKGEKAVLENYLSIKQYNYNDYLTITSSKDITVFNIKTRELLLNITKDAYITSAFEEFEITSFSNPDFLNYLKVVEKTDVKPATVDFYYKNKKVFSIVDSSLCFCHLVKDKVYVSYYIGNVFYVYEINEKKFYIQSQPNSQEHFYFLSDKIVKEIDDINGNIKYDYLDENFVFKESVISSFAKDNFSADQTKDKMYIYFKNALIAELKGHPEVETFSVKSESILHVKHIGKDFYYNFRGEIIEENKYIFNYVPYSYYDKDGYFVFVNNNSKAVFYHFDNQKNLIVKKEITDLSDKQFNLNQVKSLIEKCLFTKEEILHLFNRIGFSHHSELLLTKEILKQVYTCQLITEEEYKEIFKELANVENLRSFEVKIKAIQPKDVVILADKILRQDIKLYLNNKNKDVFIEHGKIFNIWNK